MTARRGRPSERGHLLVDFFLASFVFASAFATFVAVSGAKATALRDAEDRVRAVAAAESVLAELEAGGRKAEDGAFETTRLPEGAGEVRVSPRDDGLRAVRVTVHWRDVAGAMRKVELDGVLP